MFKKIINISIVCFFLNLGFSLNSSSAPAVDISSLAKLKGKKIAAAVYPQGNLASEFIKSAQTHLESILNDNSIMVLDEKKARELKDVFPGLENPGAFVTAETFVENADKYEIEGLLAVYLSTDTTHGIANYYSATAQADIRFVDRGARVEAETNQPMGTPGYPPSDGLTRDSAILNAIQRAIDNSCEQIGLKVLDPVRPKFIKVTLRETRNAVIASNSPRHKENSRSLWSLANLENQTWTKEGVTCTATSPDGSLGAVAGYIKDTDFHRRPRRIFGSRIHLIDLRTNREVNTFDCHPLGKKERREKGTREVLDVLFLSDWRFLAAVTGNELFLWETERGRLMSSVFLEGGVKDAELNFVRDQGKSYLVLDSKKKSQLIYEIVF